MFFNRSAQGKIHAPKNGDLVPRHFRAEGSIGNLPADRRLLLVIQVGGLVWPKGEVRVNETTWASEVYEGGTPPDGKFTLSLYSVSSKGFQEIATWLEHGKLTGHYPGLKQVKDGIKLHSIKLRLQ